MMAHSSTPLTMSRMPRLVRVIGMVPGCSNRGRVASLVDMEWSLTRPVARRMAGSAEPAGDSSTFQAMTTVRACTSPLMTVTLPVAQAHRAAKSDARSGSSARSRYPARGSGEPSVDCGGARHSVGLQQFAVYRHCAFDDEAFVEIRQYLG